MISIGIHTELSSDEYHAHKESISRSALMDFKKSPYHYWAKHINPEREIKESTAAMEFGSAFHTLILESEKFPEDYRVKPEPVLLKEVGKELYKEYKDTLAAIETSNKKILSVEQFNRLLAMKKSLQNNLKAKELVEDAAYETSYFWEDEGSGLLVKARPDIVHSNIIVDLKTVSDASERTIQNEIFKYGYDTQMAMIKDGILKLTNNEIQNFVLICVEKEYPYGIGIYILDESIIIRAHDEYKDLLMQFKECKDQNDWPDYAISTIYLPSWLK